MKIIPQIDTYPRLVTFGESPLGKLVLLAGFAAALKIDGLHGWPELTLVTGILSFLPKHRTILTSLAAVLWLFLHNSWINWDFIGGLAETGHLNQRWILDILVGSYLAAIFCGVALLFRYVRNRQGSFLARRPVLVMVCGYFVILSVAGLVPLHGDLRTLIWLLIALLSPYLWYFAYALQDARSKTADGFVAQFGAMRPFYNMVLVSSTPVGKGRAYLRKVETKTSRELSVVQLKAVKLLVWIAVLQRLRHLLQVVLYGEFWKAPATVFHHFGLVLPNLHIPTLETAINLSATGVQLPSGIAWASLIAHFVQAVLGLYVSGNVAVACCRMAGFYILRNTYRPLESQTIAEFWNRFYYYFKELLVEFFFFPVYMRYFKKYPRLRKIAATMAAATLGNMIYHFCRDFAYVHDLGLRAAVTGFQVYAFYTFLLGLGICISQMRSRPAIPAGGIPWIRRLFSFTIVVGFFCLLDVFDYEPRAHTLGAHFAFFLNLFSFHR
jgi:hypothetical protein